jgi:diacylglycerol O-acyltransferase / wax synthase
MSRHRMAAGDAAWLHMDRRVNRMIVHSVMWFDEPQDWSKVRTLLQERLIARFPRFSQRVVETATGVWWEDDPDFDLELHLGHTVLAAPGDADQLAAYVSEIADHALPRDRPLWQLRIVDGYNGHGSALVARIHHCIADGIALSRVLMSLTDDPAEAASVRVRDDDRPSSLQGFERPLARVATAVLRNASEPRRALAGARQVVPVIRALVKLVSMRPDAHTALRGELGTSKTVAWSAPISLAALREAAHAEGATINDLVLAALSGALRSYLARTEGHARDVRVILPVNLRPPAPTLPAGLGNEFGLIFLTLPVSVDDPHQRVALVRERTAELKESADAVVSLSALELIGNGRYRAEQLFIDAFSVKGSAVVTNVTGPTRPVYLAGRRLGGTIAWPPECGHLGLGVSVISYAGEVVVGVLADDRLLTDPHRLLTETCSQLARFGLEPVR